MSSPVPFNDARARLQAADLGGYTFEWPNEPFTAPSPASLWFAVDMTSDMLEPIELGGGVWVESGTLMVDVIVPLNWGTDVARTAAKAVADAFRGVTSGSLRYRTASIGSGGKDPERGKYWIMTVRVSWEYQDITSGA